jgi:hypothetical protein
MLFCLLANEARIKKSECRANVVKGHMSNPWHRLWPLPAAPLDVRRKMLWPLRRYCVVVHCGYLIVVPMLMPARLCERKLPR